MIGLRVLSTAAAIALLVPMVAPAASFAENPNGGRTNSVRAGTVRPGGSMRPGGSYDRGHRDGNAIIPGAVAGAVVGGVIAPQVYGGPAYYGPADVPSSDYYDDSTAASPPPGDNDAVGHCMQTHRSYDPESGTYLGDDGQRLPCP
jgi:hypothetical protein|nr:BA14K family protein [Bradyrhizobium sp.]